MKVKFNLGWSGEKLVGKHLEWHATAPSDHKYQFTIRLMQASPKYRLDVSHKTEPKLLSRYPLKRWHTLDEAKQAAQDFEDES